MKNIVPVSGLLASLCLFSTRGYAHSLSFPHVHFESAAVMLVMVILVLSTVFVLQARSRGEMMAMAKTVILKRFAARSRPLVRKRVTTLK